MPSYQRPARHPACLRRVRGWGGDPIPLVARRQVIFTETATHGALTWTAEHDRRVLAFKFSPAFAAYAAGR